MWACDAGPLQGQAVGVLVGRGAIEHAAVFAGYAVEGSVLEIVVGIAIEILRLRVRRR